MDNKNMVVYKESFISKIGKFFKNLFSKKEIQTEEIQIEQEAKQEEVKKEEPQENKFFSGIKVDTTGIDKVTKRKAFLEKVDGNIEELSKLSMEELTKLEKYYDKVIEQNNEIIKKLQESA